MVHFTSLPFLLAYLCVNVGSQGLLVVALPALFIPQSTSLWVWPRCHESHPPWLPISAPPTSLDECFFHISLVVRLPCDSISVSCGCFLF